jgi:septum site-determining protein MinC
VDGDTVTARESVVLKGGRYGVSIVIRDGADFNDVIAELRRKLSSARGFFSNESMRVDDSSRALTPGQREILEATLNEFGIRLDDTEVSERPPVRRHAADQGMKEQQPEQNDRTLLHKRTLRSGQRIDFDGNVVVLGDVNPGAVIVCTGDIVVFGALRGMAHAGAKGDVRAIVAALRLEPTQLRIARFISRAPDDDQAHPSVPEVARVRDESIVIEAFST